MKEFAGFILEKGDLFKLEDLENILKTAVKKDRMFNVKYEELMKSVPSAIGKFYPEYRFKNTILIKRAINNCEAEKIFPPYYAAPIIKTKTLEKFPELEKTVNLLAGKFNDSIMTDLNYRSDYLNQTPEKIAKDFLVKNKLYRPSRNGNSGTVRIGSKIFGEQYILTEMYKLLIEGYTNYKVETKTGLGGTKICFDALMNDAIDFYPEYIGT